MKLQDKTFDLEKSLKLLKRQAEAIRDLQKEGRAKEKRLTSIVSGASFKLCEAMAVELVSKIPEDVQELVRDAWAFNRHTGGSGTSYETFMGRVFPQERLVENNGRWLKLTAKHEIPARA